MNNSISKVQFLTRTAIVLALTVVFQMVGRMLPNNNFIVGPLVNACLLVATAFAGVWGGIAVAIASPLTSLINNHAPVAMALLPFSPFIMAGNVVFVLSYYLLRNKNVILGVGIGAVLKFGFLYAAIHLFLTLFSFPKFAKALTLLFGWPQLLTALIGGLLALVVIISTERAINQGTNF